MNRQNQEVSWQQFAQTGDPMMYIRYKRTKENESANRCENSNKKKNENF